MDDTPPIDWTVTPAGIVLPVKVQPSARRNGLTGTQAGRLKVAVSQAPEKGKANRAVIETLADALQLKKTQIALIAGETSSQKQFLLRDIAPQELADKLAAAIKLAANLLQR